MNWGSIDGKGGGRKDHRWRRGEELKSRKLGRRHSPALWEDRRDRAGGDPPARTTGDPCSR